MSILTARRLIDLPQKIHTTSSVLDLTSQLLMANPFLLALSPAILLTILLASIPFMTLIFRLLLVGYFIGAEKGRAEWHVKEWADWGIVGTVLVWLWSWGVARGILRTTCAGVIGAWYYAEWVAFFRPPPLPFLTCFVLQPESSTTTSNGYAYHSRCHPSLHLSIPGIHRPECTHNGMRSFAHAPNHRLTSPAFILPVCSPTLASATHDRRRYGSWLLGKRDHIV